jgi:hypothetical protein
VLLNEKYIPKKDNITFKDKKCAKEQEAFGKT